MPSFWSPWALPHPAPGMPACQESLLSPPLLSWENWEVEEMGWGGVLELVLP